MSGGGSSGSTTSTTQNYSPEEAARRTQVMDEAQRIYQSTKGQIANSPYPGAKVADFSPETLAAQNYVTQYAADNAVQGVADMNQGVSYGLNDAMYVDNNPYLQSAISAAIRPISEKYLDPNGVLANIRSDAVGNGQYGGTRQGLAEGIAGGRYLSEVGDVAAQMASAGYDKGQDTFARTLAFAPSALQAGMIPASMMSSVGLQKEMLQQAENQYESDSRMWDLNSQWAPLQNYANMVYGGSNPTAVTTSDSGSRSSGAMGMLGGTMAGAQVGSYFGPTGTAIGAGAGALLSFL